MPKPAVGIFFFVGGEILMDAVPVDEGEPYGYAIQHGSHYGFWDSPVAPKTQGERRLKARLKAGAYDAFPLGRVVFFLEENRFCIYVDRCLTRREWNVVIEKFGLSGVDREIQNDEHYQCARCNPWFMD